jgi:hypothetical protein
VEAATPLIDDALLYLYGFVWRMSELPPLGGVEDAGEVFLVESGDVACAASLVSGRDYRRLSDGSCSASEQLEWITPRAWRHHQVLRRVHETATVVPLKFGTLCATVEALRTLLEEFRHPIGQLLARFERKDEWTLKLHPDPNAIAIELQRMRPELTAMLDEERHLPQGRAYFVRKKREQATAAAVADALAALERRVFERLVEAGHEIARDQGGNAAMLVERQRFGELEGMLADLESEHASSHLAFELVGPWPPYSFATNEICQPPQLPLASR